jgi:hypothetical protein
MKVIGFIDQEHVAERILHHCGKWIRIKIGTPAQIAGGHANYRRCDIDRSFLVPLRPERTI